MLAARVELPALPQLEAQELARPEPKLHSAATSPALLEALPEVSPPAEESASAAPLAWLRQAALAFAPEVPAGEL